MAFQNGGLIKLMYISEVTNWHHPTLWPRVDLWNATEDGKKSTWLGALIMDSDGKIQMVGIVPAEVKRNLEQMLIDSLLCDEKGEKDG